MPGGRDGIWADLGTGSGALSIAVARCLSNKGRVRAWSALFLYSIIFELEHYKF